MRRWIISLSLLFVLAACNLTTETATPETTPPPDIPKVEFLQPVNETTIVEGAELAIDALASDTGIGVARVELLVDDQKINERGPDISAAVPTFRVSMNWLAQGLGRHTLTLLAYRPDNTQSDPATIIVNVLPADPTASP